MEPQLKVSVLEDERTVFGDHEVRLLEAIARQGSLSDGVATLGLSYRNAWGRIKAVEASLGTKLVETTVGGRDGGSTRLTEAALRLVDQYNRFRLAVGTYAAEEFARCFGGSSVCAPSEASRPESEAAS